MTRLEDVPLEVLVDRVNASMDGLVDAYAAGLVTEAEVLEAHPRSDPASLRLTLRVAALVRSGRGSWGDPDLLTKASS